ncbi:hypothetical protein C8N46_10297 [Kordia periserrulae]|uniref:Uncharacterized protein n=1 Tax=Kordia periserrulae TaxID=701523 RepID=A0A2T6C309_9FLAO|nr:hypothetical protein [Kordia periserrulae]PTX62701.1 hypothetical protein C8N46_10297 [Kordia periserrulae]
MKKQQIKNLQLNKKSISNLKKTSVKGGTSGLACYSIYFMPSICFDHCQEK